MIGVVHELVEDGLRELADERYQRDLWLASGGLDEVSSFTECVERLLDDSGLSYELDKGGVVYTTHIDERLRALRALLDQIDDSRTPEDILRDPRLHEARSHAYALLQNVSQFGSGDT